MVASLRDSARVSSPARRFSPTTPVILSAFCSSVSMLLYVPSHFAAVFGPTFGMPGMLSELSPIKAR